MGSGAGAARNLTGRGAPEGTVKRKVDVVDDIDAVDDMDRGEDMDPEDDRGVGEVFPLAPGLPEWDGA